ncbi:esterase, partial [Escherichia coli]|nr:esterase [Escherichia coli]
MYFNHCFEQKSVLLTTFILVAAAVVTFLFPEVWYPQENAWHLS